jgi:hypothetical protein
LVYALVAAGIVGPFRAAAEAEPAACASVLSTEVEALAEAARCNDRVEVLPKRSETTQVFALPSGDLAAEISAVPVRVHRADGSWASTDTTLRREADGSLVPTAAVADVRFSGGGTAALVTFTAGGGQMAYSWPSALPTPTLEGDSAVYSEVFPGVDLRVCALVAGFRYVLVVKDAAAAANPALRAITLGLSASGLTLSPRPQGGFDAVDPSGTVTITADGAAMWDARGLSEGAAQVDPAVLAAQTPDGSAVAQISASATATSLTVTPDQAMLTDPATVFPVVIDPVATLSNFAWGYADSTNSNRDDGVARVGDNTDGSGIYRSYFYFNSGAAIGSAAATVTDANFSARMTHSYSCTNTPVNAYSVGAFSAGRNAWSGPAIQSGGWLGERYGHAHKPTAGSSNGCADDPQPDMTLVWDDAYVKNRVQFSHDQGWSSFAVGLMARQSDGSSEGTNEWWKKFDPASTRLYVAWNRTPTAATNVKLLPANVTDCSTAATALTNDNVPTICATPHDADGGTNRVEFEVWNSAHTTRITSSNGSVTNKTVESPAGWTVPTTLADGTYGVRAQSCDAYACGPWSSWGSFTVDTLPPSVPVIASQSGGAATYQPKSTGVWAGGVGVSGNFSFTSSTDATGIEVELNASSLGWKTPTSGVWTGAISPSKDGVNVLRSRSKDAAGNTGGWVTYEFLVAPAVSKVWRWELDSSLASVDTVGSTVTDPGQYPLSGFTPTYVASPTSNAVTFGGTQGLAVSGPVLDTKGSFSVVARVRLGTLTPSGPMTIVSQDGSSGSGFRLQYRTDVDVTGDAVADKAWCFAMFGSDGAADTALSRSCMASQATTSDWVTFAGVHDAVNHRVQLWIYVAETLEAVMIVPDTAFTNSWSATGALAIGRARQGGAAGQFWNGAIDRVAVFNQKLDANGLTTEMKKA